MPNVRQLLEVARDQPNLRNYANVLVAVENLSEKAARFDAAAVGELADVATFWEQVQSELLMMIVKTQTYFALGAYHTTTAQQGQKSKDVEGSRLEMLETYTAQMHRHLQSREQFSRGYHAAYSESLGFSKSLRQTETHKRIKRSCDDVVADDRPKRTKTG